MPNTARLAEIAQINPATDFDFPDDELCTFVPMEAVDDVVAQITKPATRRYHEVATGYTAFAENDVIVAKITPCMENGKCAIARNLRNKVGFGSTEFHVLRASKHVLPEWLFYFWRLPETRRVAERIMTGSAGQKRVPAGFLGSLEILLPGLSEQQRMVGLLAQADRLRRTRRYALELGDAFLPAAFLELFGDGSDRYPLFTVEELAADKPNAVRTGPFGSQLLHSEFIESGIAVLGIDNAVENRFEWRGRRFINPQKFDQLRRYVVHPGDVLITIMGTCGRCAIVPDNMPPVINTKHLCCITLDQGRCLPAFLHGAFLWHPFVRRQLGASQKGAIMEGLNMQIIRNLRVPLPPIPLQSRFASLAERHERLLVEHREALRQAGHLFQSLLHRTFSGDL